MEIEPVRMVPGRHSESIGVSHFNRRREGKRSCPFICNRICSWHLMATLKLAGPIENAATAYGHQMPSITMMDMN